MEIQFFEEKKLVKKTKPKTSWLVKENGFVKDEATGEVMTFQEFYKPFIDKYVTVTVTESTKENVEEDEE